MQDDDGYGVDTCMCNRRFEPIKILIILLFLKLCLNSKSPIKKAFLCFT